MGSWFLLHIVAIATIRQRRNVARHSPSCRGARDDLAHGRIECLECGKRFTFLGPHLRMLHGIAIDEYRASWGMPAQTPLAGLAFRAMHAAKFRRMQASGAIDYSHLPGAIAAAAKVPRPKKVPMDAASQSARVKKRRPGDAHKLPPGAKRAGNRDADRAREYQQAHRAMKVGDMTLMTQYREKWNAKPPKPIES